MVNVCVKSGVQEKSGSPDMGSNGGQTRVKLGVIRLYLKILSFVFLDFLHVNRGQ